MRLQAVVFLTICAICKAQHAPVSYLHGQKWALKDNRTTEAKDLLLRWEYLESVNFGTFLNGIMDDGMLNTVADVCRSDIQFIINGLKSNDSVVRGVAFRYVDAQGKIPHGVLQGNAMWVGDYQECLAVDRLANPLTGSKFGGKYFTVAIYIDKAPAPANLGLCLPDTCNTEDAKNLTNEAIQLLMKLQPLPLKAFAISAYTKDQTEIKGGVLATVIISSLIVLLVVIGTIVGIIDQAQNKANYLVQDDDIEQTDLSYSQPSEHTHLLSDKVFRPLHRKREWPRKEIVSILKSFSFLDNCKKLFGTDTAHGPLACLNGLRVMSMWWVILGHTYEFSLRVMENPFEAQKLIERFSFQFVANGTLSVDTFFFLSGLLVAYLSFKEIREKNRMNWVYFICHRYWRLTPLYAFVILFFANIARPVVYGPFSALMPEFKTIDTCKTYWWTNLLYINNFYPDHGSLGSECLAWSWYLANDMQFYLFLSPIVILLLWKSRKLGVAFACFLIIGGLFSRGFLQVYYGMHVPDGIATKHTDDPWAIGGSYIRPYTRWPVYVVGMLTGFYLSAKNLRINLNRTVATVGWCVCTATAIAVLWGQYHYLSRPGSQMSMPASVLYSALHRTAWSASLTWIVIACVAGKGGPVKDILSWTIWAPLGRLTYAAYMVHPIVIVVYLFNLLTPLHFSDLVMVYVYIGNLVVTYGVAFVVSMAVEAPMIQLEKAALNMFKKRR